MAIEDEPPRPETEKQVDAVLKSLTFKRQTRLRDMLHYLAVKALDRVAVTETVIARDLFNRPQLAPDDRIVRANASHLRAKLLQYYAVEAPEALILIELKPGPGYKPEFSYNPHSEAEQRVRRGFYHLKQQSSADIEEALTNFDLALERAPTHSAAHAGKAEALCTQAMYSPGLPPSKLIAEASEAANEALKWGESTWRAHVASGIVHLCRRDGMAAKHAFELASAISKFETRDHIWYPAYLFTSGHTEAALETTRCAAIDQYDIPSFRRVYGMYLYLDRKFDEAERVLRDVLKLDRNSWLAHVTLAFVLLATGRPAEALSHMRRIELLLDVPAWPGLLAMSLAESGDTESASSVLRRLLEVHQSNHVQPLQLALAFNACGDQEAAIQQLERACDECDPFLIWIERLPIFDPLRGHPRFTILVKNIKED